MVFSTAKLKVIVPGDSNRINIGDNLNQPSNTNPFQLPNLLGNLFGGTYPVFGVPNPGGAIPDTIGDIQNPPGSNTSCPTNYILVNGNCIPLTSLPACPSGYTRDPTSGLCVTTPTGTTPPVGAVGQITRVDVPARVIPGETAMIKVWFKNFDTVARKFATRITVPTISIDHFTPMLEVAAGQTAAIETTVALPANAAPATVSATAQLLREIPTVAGQVILEDSKTFQILIDTSVPYQCPPNLPACPTGQHRDAATCTCLPDTVTPPPTTTGVYYTLVRKVGDISTYIPTQAQLQTGYGVTVTQYQTNQPNEIICTTTGCLVGWIVVNVPATQYNDSILRGLGFTAGINIPSPVGGTTPPPAGTATIGTDKTTYKLGRTITITGAGFLALETVRMYLTIDGALVQEKNVTATSAGKVSGTLTASKKGGGHAQLKGRTSLRHADKYVKIEK